jgi:two-component system chemotaxis response regulator CheY
VPIKSSLKIIVIDDQKAQRQVIKLILQQIGFKHIDTAASGADGIATMQTAQDGNEPFEFIICDYEMPEMTGIDTFNKLQEDENLKKIPFLLISGDADRSFIQTAIKTGIRHILLKPFTKQGMVNEMSKILDG